MFGKRKYLLGETEDYKELKENVQLNGYLVISTVMEGTLQAEFEEYWCVPEYISKEEKLCVKALLTYFMKENCQKSYFTVESERLSGASPLHKDIFYTNYCENGEGGRMPFIKDYVENEKIQIRP